jgi:chromosome segregation ATPase
MLTKTLLLVAFFIFSSTVHAQKLYKVLDADGNVSFSQFPPVDKEETSTVEDITVGSSPKTTITDGVDGTYCGEIRLPVRSSSGKSMASQVKSLERNRAAWREQLDRLSQRVDENNQRAIKTNQASSKYNSYNDQYKSKQNKRYQESIASNGERLRNLRCAISWANKEYSGVGDFVSKNKDERDRLENIRDGLQSSLDTSCGEIPAYDPNIRSNESIRKRWYDCSDSLRREIDVVEREIRKT